MKTIAKTAKGRTAAPKAKAAAPKGKAVAKLQPKKMAGKTAKKGGKK